MKNTEKNITSNITNENTATITGTNFISDGVGGRQKIVYNGSYLTSLVNTAYSSEVYNPTGNAYIYSGFANSSVETDMGLQYDPDIGPYSTEKGWKPYMVVKSNGNTKPVVFDPNYDDVQYKNGYKEGSDVTFYVYKNYNGKVRLKLDGTATCADLSCYNSTDTRLISIYETTDLFNISSIDYWKLLATVVSTNETGINQADYKLIKVDGNLVPSYAFQTPEEDHANITRDIDNNVYIRVDSTKY